MSLANLFNAPSEDQEFLVWSFSNQDHHELIANAIFAKKNIRVPIYSLDPIPMGSIEEWARSHQEAHNNFNQVLGIAGADLTDVNLKDPGEVESWIRLHGEEHRQAAQILGL